MDRLTPNLRYKEAKKAWAQRNKEKMREYRRKHHAKDPQKQAARMAVSNAHRSGRIPKATDLACIYCSQPAVHYHHHNGYEKEHWLDVVPVCTRCHVDIEQQMKMTA